VAGVEKSSNGIVDIENGATETVVVTFGALGAAMALRRRAGHARLLPSIYVLLCNRRLATLATVNSSQLASRVLAFTEGVILTIYGR